MKMNILRYKLRLLSLVIVILIPVLFTTCKKFVKFEDKILITGTETDKIAKFVVENTPSSFSVTATSTTKVSDDMTVHFDIDTTLVAVYEAEKNAVYYVAPEGSYELSSKTGVIKAGKSVSEAITVTITSTADYIDGRSYLIPVTIKSVDGSLEVLEPSRTIYLKVARVYKFNSLDISNYNFYRTMTFTTPHENMKEFTYEIKCFINSWHTGNPPISRVSVWGPADGSMFNLLRFGEGGSDVNQLQWINSSGSVFSNTRFATGRWYTISCVYTGTKCRLYVDGVLDNEFDAGGQVYSFSLLELGMSYSGYQNSQRYLGRIAEIRLWDRALSRTEIQEGICGVYSGADGIVAYWKLNEGTGQTFYDCTGHGYDMIWPYTAVWNTDDTNKCSQ
jgi:hypothetical protein